MNKPASTDILSRLQDLSLKQRLLALVIIYLLFPYAVVAFQLFPNGDAFNLYAGHYHYLISSLLDGHIPLWDPMAACGWPMYLSFMTLGVFDPTLAVAVGAGKVFALNVLQIYWLWILLRNLPVLLGMFWLLRQICRHDTVALAGAAFVYFSMAFLSLEDAINYTVYWPLMLAAVVNFIYSLKQGRPSWPALATTVVFSGISLLLYNPAYVLLLLMILTFSGGIFYFRELRSAVKKVPLSRWRIIIFATGIGLSGLCSPLVVLWKNYQSGDYLAYLRVHQSQKGPPRPNSILMNDSIDYVDVVLSNSPMYRAKGVCNILNPFWLQDYLLKDEKLYLGAWGLLGLTAGLFYKVSRKFLFFFLSALTMAFFMTWSANYVLKLLYPFFPFLKFMNQRPLLYPGFLMLATTAASVGFCQLWQRSSLEKLAARLSWGKTLLTGGLVLIVFSFLAVIFSDTGVEIRQTFGFNAVRFSAVFLLVISLLAYLIRCSLRDPGVYKKYVLVLLCLYVVDIYMYLGEFTLTHLPDRYKGMVTRSRSLREKMELDYQPYRSVILPAANGGTRANSVVHLANLRTALPAYWHCDIFFSTRRYYELISSLSADRLRGLLAITTPVMGVFSTSQDLEPGQDALAVMGKSAARELGTTIFLEENLPKALDSGVKFHRPFAQAEAVVNFLPASPLYLDQFDESLYAKLFDHVIYFPEQGFEESNQGLYEKRLYRLNFSPLLPLEFDNEADMLARYFFPDFPFAFDVEGKLLWGTPQRDKIMTLISGAGILLEAKEEVQDFPSKVYVLYPRPKPPDSVKVLNFEPNRVVVEATSDKDAVLGYADLYDRNWRATVDGQPVQVLLANHAFKAVRLPAGKHRVEFLFQVPYLIETMLLYYGIVLGYLFWVAHRCWPVVKSRAGSKPVLR